MCWRWGLATSKTGRQRPVLCSRAERCHHTSELGDPSEFRGQRVLIVGGRQSAFESAALLQEAGAAEIYLTYRHATPEFTASDWSWVQPLVMSMVSDPGWFRRMVDQEREALVKRFWVEGRQKLEPWLAPRIDASNVHLFPGTSLLGCDQGADGIRVWLDSGEMLGVDEVVFATGFKMDPNRFRSSAQACARASRRATPSRSWTITSRPAFRDST